MQWWRVKTEITRGKKIKRASEQVRAKSEGEKRRKIWNEKEREASGRKGKEGRIETTIVRNS